MKDTISLNPLLNKEIISLSAHCATSRLTENYISSSPVTDLCNMYSEMLFKILKCYVAVSYQFVICNSPCGKAVKNSAERPV